LSPNDKLNLLNFSNFNDFGINTVKDSTAFKKIQYYSKVNFQHLFNTKSDFEQTFNKLSSLYINDNLLNESVNYGIRRQHNYNSLMSIQNLSNSVLDKKSVNKYYTYNLNYTKSFENLEYGKFYNLEFKINNFLNKTNFNNNNIKFLNYIRFPEVNSFLNRYSDSKQFSNLFKYNLNILPKKKFFKYKDWTEDIFIGNDLSILNPVNSFNIDITNKKDIYDFKDLKSSNLQFLTNERNLRLIKDFHSSKLSKNYSTNQNNYVNILENMLNNKIDSQNKHLYNLSKFKWANREKNTKLLNNNLSTFENHLPIYSDDFFLKNTSYDLILKGEDDLSPSMLRSKEESAPSYLFSSYWLNYWSQTNPYHHYDHLINLNLFFNKNYFPIFNDYAEYDFRN
jgi:hypothetical protein